MSSRYIHRLPTIQKSYQSSFTVDYALKASNLMSDVHGTSHGKKAWRNRPLFRREGDKTFQNGQEAAEMLYDEVVRRDPYQVRTNYDFFSKY